MPLLASECALIAHTHNCIFTLTRCLMGLSLPLKCEPWTPSPMTPSPVQSPAPSLGTYQHLLHDFYQRVPCSGRCSVLFSPPLRSFVALFFLLCKLFSVCLSPLAFLCFHCINVHIHCMLRW